MRGKGREADKFKSRLKIEKKVKPSGDSDGGSGNLECWAEKRKKERRVL